VGDGTSGTTGASSTGQSVVVDEDLVLWIQLDDVADQDFSDASGNENDGACVEGSCPLESGGPVGSAGVFDGIDDYVLVPHHPSLETPDGFTAAAWIRLESLPGTQRSFLTKTFGTGVSNSWELYFFDGQQGRVLFSMVTEAGEVSANATEPAIVGEWFHVAGTWDGSDMRLWIDGINVASSRIGSLSMDDHPVLIGVDDDNDAFGYDGYFDGGIDDVRLYQRALTAEEIAELATAR
ncbi:MAG: LamG domain-containing protein, partial [Myxococcota bacterium]